MDKPDTTKIGNMIHSYRRMNEIQVRDLAKEIGIGASTLCLVEAGKSVDQETMLKLINWMFS